MSGIISAVLNCIQWVYEETKFIPCAYWNKKKLKKEMGRLDGMRRDVTTITNNQKQMQPGTQCKVVVSSWLDRVSDKKTEVNGLLDSIQQRRSGCTCCFAAGNGIKLLELIDDVHVLVVERKTFDDKELVEPIPVDNRQTFKDKMRKKMEELKRMQEDVEKIIHRQEREKPRTECKVVVNRWLDDVRRKEEEVNNILHSVAESSNWVENVKDLTVSIQSLVEEGRNYVDDKILVYPVPVNHKKNLERKMEDLKRMQEVVNEIIKKQEREQPGTECKIAVRSWLDAVNRKDEEVHAILHPVAAEETINGAYVNVADLIDSIQSLVEERKTFDDKELIQSRTVNPIDNVPDLTTHMVGRNSKLLEIHGYIKDSSVKTIGIWGAGGIGKTTLLKSIKDELRSKNRELFFFFYIVWIEISSQNTIDILDIQKQIAKCISLTLHPEQDELERARTLTKALRHKKTLVLIDNVWNELDFERIGIPFSIANDLLKIVLTTRYERVCTDMSTQKIVKLDYLDEEESLQLFQNNVSSDHVDLKNQMVSQRVHEILQKCSGLPLAIVTIAKTVAYYTRVEEWDDAVDCLQNSPEDIEGMDDVMRCLKFSYDKLESNEIRSCLLYFSLYPQGDEILIDELIKEWIGEGFLDDISNKNSFKKSYARGHVFINKLKSFCLVEKSPESDFHVKVHDVIREMLCWICKNERKEVFLVYDEDHDDISNYNDLHLVKGMYLNERQLKSSTHENGMSLFPNVTSIFVQANHSYRILKLPTEDFFHFTTFLRVLDLSFIGLVELPKSIGDLRELRHLNLFHTRIKMLPVELGNLKKLECLDLGDTDSLKSIPNAAISQLSMLQSLNLLNSGYHQWSSDSSTMPLLMLEDLTKLKNLEDLALDVSSNSHVNTILDNQILFNSILKIGFKKIDFVKENLQPIKVISKFPVLKELSIDQCVMPDNILDIKDNHQVVVEELFLWNLEISSVVIVKNCCPFHNLEYLHIFNCRCLKEVSWTTHIPSLQWLQVQNCNGVEELVATGEEEEIEEERDSYFPKLLFLHIKDMENLHSIYGRRNRQLLFPKLKELCIENCPKLKGLSLGLDSAKGIQIILCEQHQWDLLEWEDDQVRAKFLPYFHFLL